MSVRSQIRLAPEGTYHLKQGDIEKLWIVAKGDVHYYTRNNTKENPSSSQRIVAQRTCNKSWLGIRILEEEGLAWLRQTFTLWHYSADTIKLLIHASPACPARPLVRRSAQHEDSHTPFTSHPPPCQK